MTSSMSRDEDGDVTMTSSQDGGGDAEPIPSSVQRREFLLRRWNVTTPTEDSGLPRSVSLNLRQDGGQGQSQGQTNGEGQDECRCEVEKPRLVSVGRSTSVDVENTSRTKTTKPQKPAKPKNLWSHGTTGNGNLRSRGSSQVGVSKSQSFGISLTSSQPSRQSGDDAETTRGQNGLHADVEQSTQWTTTSTTLVSKSSDISVHSRQSSVCAETTNGQLSLCSNGEHLTHETTVSPQTFSPTSSVKLSYLNPDVDAETACRQDSPRCENEKQANGTTVSMGTVSRRCETGCFSQPLAFVVESPCEQTSLHSDDNRLTERTTYSTETIPHENLSSEQSADGGNITCRQDCPRYADDQLTQSTFIPSATRSPHVDRLTQPLAVAVETTCRQSSPHSNDEQQPPWTKESLRVQVSVDGSSDRIEPPIIYDLLPDNVHIRRGGTLQLVAQFTAFPPPDVSWHRANDLLTPGHRPSIVINITSTYCK